VWDQRRGLIWGPGKGAGGHGSVRGDGIFLGRDRLWERENKGNFPLGGLALPHPLSGNLGPLERFYTCQPIRVGEGLFRFFPVLLAGKAVRGAGPKRGREIPPQRKKKRVPGQRWGDSHRGFGGVGVFFLPLSILIGGDQFAGSLTS